jgi:hypothetical protein
VVPIPNWTFVGWMTLITEMFIGVTLLLGLFAGRWRWLLLGSSRG